MQYERNNPNDGVSDAFEDRGDRRFVDQREEGPRAGWDVRPAQRESYQGGYGYPSGSGERRGGYPYGEGGLYGQRERTPQPYPRRGYDDVEQNEYGSRARDRYRESQYGQAGRPESEYTTGGRRDEEWPRGAAYSRGEYDRAQSDWADRQYGAGTRNIVRSGNSPGGGYAGQGYGQGPISSHPHLGNRNPEQRGPKGYSRSDDRIREDVCDCFMRARAFNPSEIEVEVKDGEVTLSGEVDDREEKFDAERTAESVLGVRDVNNNLRCGRRHSDESDTTRSSHQRASITTG